MDNTFVVEQPNQGTNMVGVRVASESGTVYVTAEGGGDSTTVPLRASQAVELGKHLIRLGAELNGLTVDDIVVHTSAVLTGAVHSLTTKFDVEV